VPPEDRSFSMKQRSTIVSGLLALVLAFGMITGCEGPAGPGGPSGTEGFNQDELAFIHANGFAVAVQRMLGGVTNFGTVAASGAAVTWTPGGAIAIDEAVTLNIPAGVTFDIANSSNTVTVGTAALTVNGGPGSVFKVSGSGALTTTADAASQLTVNVPVLVLGATPSLNAASTVNMSGVSKFDLTAAVIDTVLASAGVTNTAGKEVTVRGASSAGGAITLAKLTVAGGTFTGGVHDITVPGGIELTGGSISGTGIVADVTVSANATIAAALTLTAGTGTTGKLTVTSGTFAVSNVVITAPGGIILAGGTFAGGTSSHEADVTVTGNVTLATSVTKLAAGHTLTLESGTFTANQVITADGIIINGGTFTSTAAHVTSITANGGALGAVAALATGGSNTITIPEYKTVAVTGVVGLAAEAGAMVLNGTLAMDGGSISLALANLGRIDVSGGGVITGGGVTVSDEFVGTAAGIPYNIVLSQNANAVANDTTVAAGASIIVPASKAMTVNVGKVIDLSAAGAAIVLEAGNATVVLAVANSSGNPGGQLVFGAAGLELSLDGTNYSTAETVTAETGTNFQGIAASNITNLPDNGFAATAQFIKAICNDNTTKGQITLAGIAGGATLSAASTWEKAGS
jgi:hypothetical protein